MYKLEFYLYSALAGFIAIIIHEYTKIYVSAIQGDKTNFNNLKLVFNPLKSINILGLLFLAVFGVGFSNPAEISYSNYFNKRKGAIITYLTPIIVNLLVGALFAIIYYLLKIQINSNDFTNGNYPLQYKILVNIVYYVSKLNIVFAFINLIPIYPMSGYKILLSILSEKTVINYVKNEKILLIIFLMLGVFGVITYYTNYFVNLILGNF